MCIHPVPNTYVCLPDDIQSRTAMLDSREGWGSPSPTYRDQSLAKTSHNLGGKGGKNLSKMERDT